MTAAHQSNWQRQEWSDVFDDRTEIGLRGVAEGFAGVGRALYWIPAGLRRALPLLLSDRLFVALRIWRRASATRSSLKNLFHHHPHPRPPPSINNHCPLPLPFLSRVDILRASFLISPLLQHPQQNQERLAFHLSRPADAKALHLHVAAMFVRKRGKSFYFHNAHCFEVCLTRI